MLLAAGRAWQRACIGVQLTDNILSGKKGINVLTV
jgi:hypothetical protein